MTLSFDQSRKHACVYVVPLQGLGRVGDVGKVGVDCRRPGGTTVTNFFLGKVSFECSKCSYLIGVSRKR